jgi:hypothetical protein
VELWDAAGVLAWSATWTQDLAGDVADDGSVLLTGRYSVIVSDPRSERQPLWVARYTPDGCSAWVLEHDFPEPYFVSTPGPA